MTVEMNQKDNALRIMRFDNPERVVNSPPILPLKYHGCDHEGYEGGGHDCPVGTRWTDIWGTGWQKEQEGVMGFPRQAPLASPSALKGYRWPDPDDERICGLIHKLAAEHRQRPDRGDFFLTARHRDTLWEKTYMLVGMENAMVFFLE
ncbi:MAG: hypothetical protein N3A38_13550, partial [Planctomycetota bacterium]|nr:hypothetical protein [Planctomycetota bacterium]